MLLIGGRVQASTSPSPVTAPDFVDTATEAVQRETSHASVDPVQAEIDRAIGDYQRRLVEETAIGSYAGVDVHLLLTGETVRIDISESVPVRYDAASIGEIILRATKAAATYAAQRRAELLEQVQLFNESAMKRLRQMQDDPEGAIEEMSAVRYW